MKTKNILAAMLLMIGTSLMAENFLTVTYGGTTDNFSLPTVQRVTFLDDYVKVTTTECEALFPISIIEKISFTDSPDAINALPEQAENLTFKNGTLAVKGDGLLCIYGSNGALVNIANVKEGANISLKNLPAGVYVVIMGDKTIKVRK